MQITRTFMTDLLREQIISSESLFGLLNLININSFRIIQYILENTPRETIAGAIAGGRQLAIFRDIAAGLRSVERIITDRGLFEPLLDALDQVGRPSRGPIRDALTAFVSSITRLLYGEAPGDRLQDSIPVADWNIFSDEVREAFRVANPRVYDLFERTFNDLIKSFAFRQGIAALRYLFINTNLLVGGDGASLVFSRRFETDQLPIPNPSVLRTINESYVRLRNAGTPDLRDNDKRRFNTITSYNPYTGYSLPVGLAEWNLFRSTNISAVRPNMPTPPHRHSYFLRARLNVFDTDRQLSNTPILESYKNIYTSDFSMFDNIAGEYNEDNGEDQE